MNETLTDELSELSSSESVERHRRGPRGRCFRCVAGGARLLTSSLGTVAQVNPKQGFRIIWSSQRLDQTAQLHGLA